MLKQKLNWIFATLIGKSNEFEQFLDASCDLGTRAAAVRALPAGLILFREFTVSALREVGAGKGVVLPVTLLAKWKTRWPR